MGRGEPAEEVEAGVARRRGPAVGVPLAVQRRLRRAACLAAGRGRGRADAEHERRGGEHREARGEQGLDEGRARLVALVRGVIPGPHERMRPAASLEDDDRALACRPRGGLGGSAGVDAAAARRRRRRRQLGGEDQGSGSGRGREGVFGPVELRDERRRRSREAGGGGRRKSCV